MAPAAVAEPNAVSSRLPISRQALSALDRLRTCAPHLASRHGQIVVSAALHHGNTVPSPPLSYVTRRLLKGVSASAGFSRVNYAIVLAALCRARSAGGACSVTSEVVDAVRDIYGSTGTFELGYAGAERERALGTIAALAAVVGAADPSSISAATAREVVVMLRGTVDGEADKWRLGCAAVRIVEDLVMLVRETEREAAVKPMWAWCVERREREDGVQMAFMLYSKGLVIGKALRGLYPSVEKGLESGLLDAFEGGYSAVRRSSVLEPKAGSLEIGVRRSWKLVTEYMLTKKGSAHLGGVGGFWNTLVVPKLLQGSRSGEKKLLALELLMLILPAIQCHETFKSVFSTSTASLIATVSDTRRDRRQSVPLRKGRTGDEVMARLTSLAGSFGSSALEEIRSMPGESDSSRPLLRAFLLWSMRGGILNQVFPPPSLHETLQTLCKEDLTKLVSEATMEFAHPRNEGGDSEGFKQLCNTLTRPNVLRFLFAIAKSCPVTTGDVVRIVSLYSIFEESQEGLRIQPQCSVEFENYKCTSTATFGGMLPSPQPALSVRIASTAFRRLVHFLAHSGSSEASSGLASVSRQTITSVLTCKKSGLILRCALHGDNQEDGRRILSDIAKAVKQTQSSVQEIPISDDVGPLLSALSLVTKFLSIHAYEPHSLDGNNSVKAFQFRMDEFISLLNRVLECSSCLADMKRTGHLKKSKENPRSQEIEAPEPIEMIAHLITDLCGRESASFRMISSIAIESLGHALDDRVVAVVFDAMDSYLLSSEDVDNVENVLRDSDVEDEAYSGDESRADSGQVAHHDEQTGDEIGESNVLPKSHSSDEKSRRETDNSDDEGSGNGENSDDDVNIDIDKEDPAVLAEFDKRLGTHLRLLKMEKRSARHRKLKAEFRYTQVSRLMGILEGMARQMRLRLEKSEDTERRLPLVILDLHARLYEFTLGGEITKMRFLKQITGIVAKQLLLPPSLFVTDVVDRTTAVEISDRFFQGLGSCSSNVKPTETESRIISKSAGLFITVSTSLSEGATERYLPIYEDMLKKMVGPEGHFCTPPMFSSFILKAPRASLHILARLEESLEAQSMTKNTRTAVSEILLSMALVVKDDSVTRLKAKQFWNRVSALVKANCCGELAKKRWKLDGFLNMVQMITNGVKGGYVGENDVSVSAILEGLKHVHIPRKEHSRYVKALRSESVAGKKRERAEEVPNVSVQPGSIENDEVSVVKKRNIKE